MNKSIYIIIILVLGSFVLYSFYAGRTEKIAYIKNIDVYNEFTYKKELESKLADVENKRKQILDSLMLELRTLSGAVDKNDKKNENLLKQFQIRKQEYVSKEKEFSEDNQMLAEQYSQQIWKQINQYVFDYGKKNGYSIIYGASGNGAIMFAQEKFDLTKEIISYINSKYNDEK